MNWILQVKVIRHRSAHSITLSLELYIADLIHHYAYVISSVSRRFDSPIDASRALTIDQCPQHGSIKYEDMAASREANMSLVGAFLWFANMTRFELSFVSSQPARFVSNPGHVHFQAALRVLIYLKVSQDRVLTLSPRVDRSALRAYVDSDWGTRFSFSGAAFELMGTLVHWLSKTQRSISMSSTEAEYFAACIAARDVLFFRDLSANLGYTQTSPSPIRSDHKGVSELSFDPVAFKKTKHILRAAEFLRGVVSRRKASIIGLSDSDNVADLFTISVELSIFRHLMLQTCKLDCIP